jgi:D-inositol-3-phosphate glycosyltransferase
MLRQENQSVSLPCSIASYHGVPRLKMTPSVWQLDPAQLTPYYNMAVCRALTEQGWQVRYVTSRFLYDLEMPSPDSFQVDYLYFRGLEYQWLLQTPRLRKLLRAVSYVQGHRKLLSQIRKERPDIIHFQWSRLPRFDYWLISKIKSLGIPVVHTIHDVVPLFEQGRVTQRLERIYSAVDALLVHAEANRAAFLRIYPSVNPERIHVIPLAAPGNSFIPAGSDQAAAREKLGIPADVPVALFFGSIKPYKGLHLLVEAFKLAVQKRHELHLLVVGRPDEVSDLPSELRMGVLPNTLLRAEYVPLKEMWLYHLAADVAVLPYRNIYQSGAMSTVLEYGLPAIVTDVGGLPELIDGNGWIVPPDDPQALADALLEALSDRQRAKQMGQRSLEVLEQCCGLDRVGTELTGIYEHCLNKSYQPSAES